MTPSLHDLLDDASARGPHRTAMRTTAGDTDYEQLRARTVAAASRLAQAGVTAGDRVVLLGANTPALAAAVLGVSRLGAVLVVLSPATTAYQLRHVLTDCTPAVVVAASDLSPLVREAGRTTGVLDLDELSRAPAEPRPLLDPPTRAADAPAALIYTSGSTSMPKAVVCTHQQMLFATDAIQDRLRLRSDDVVANLLPLSFDYGLYQLLLCLDAGATLALGSMGDIGPGLLTQLERWGATVLPAVPSMLSAVARLARRTPGTPASLRLLTSTGAHVPPSLVDDVRTALPGVDLALMFGLTECKRVSILLPEELADHPGSVGRPLRGTSCLVVDDDGRPVPPGVPGELVVRGPHVAAGYWNAPDLTARKFPWGPDGRELRTGDVCSLDEDGYLYFHGRRDDLYKIRGFRVSGIEVEAATMDTGAVSAAALVHTDAGPTLVVAGDVQPPDVLALLRHRLEEWKLPARVVVVDDLPLGPNGKIDRASALSLAGSVR